jgi:hypothetical protein
MSFFTANYSGGVLLPEEMSLVSEVFKQIEAEPWFNATDENRQHLAAFIIRTYQRGLAEPEKLRSFCAERARQRFAKPDHRVTICFSQMAPQAE